MKGKTEIDTSGFWQAEKCTEKASDRFSECSIIATDGPTLLVKARRNGRWWMLKGLKEEYRNEPLFIELFEKEVTLATLLQHPGIIQVFDVETVDPYGRCMVMEYLDGTTLNTFLKTKPAKWIRHSLAKQLLDVMEYVHSKQIVHRDLKPTNIVVTHNGKHLKIIDFGLADSDAYFMLKQPAGTEGYIAPEQRVSRTADVRNDIYSIGVILKEMKLGWLTDLAIRRCLCRADKRYANIGELQKGISRSKIIFRIACTLMIITSIGVGAMGMWRTSQRDKQMIEQFRDSLICSSMENQKTIAQFRDSLEKVTSREQQLLMKETSRNLHEQMKQEFIKEKEKEIKKEFDLLENPKHPIWHGGDLSVEINRINLKMDKWVKERDDLNSEERAAILAHFSICMNEYFQPLTKKWIDSHARFQMEMRNQLN